MNDREPDLAALVRIHERARARLLDARGPAGSWEGSLSSSALSTATAALALELAARGAAGRDADRVLAARGRAWLAAHQNADGGWGDTVASPSNPSTTALAWTALGLDPQRGQDNACLGRCEERLRMFVGTLEPAALKRALLGAYGDDRTFSVPILVACALGGRLGNGPDAWRGIPAIPFELAALPRDLFRHLGLPMVSYALPALIAIGQVLHRHAPSSNPLARVARSLSRTRTLRTLEAIQPSSGGFLEATPLTSFVVASLVGCGLHGHPVVESGLAFLRASARADGSWPIDTNLATWLTSLAIGALAADGRLADALAPGELARTATWITAQQYGRVHPYTGAAPGGWAWTDLPGGVPDADDTAGALLALAHVRRTGQGLPPEWDGAWPGLSWLLGLQNRDGGIPTFCRGWSGLPFDRSASDLSAHALRAFAAWGEGLAPPRASRLARARARCIDFLRGAQRADGSWVPLWFGNQHRADLENPLYGTARVLEAHAELVGSSASALERAERWLVEAQNEDGGFGGARGTPSTVEETGLALGALAGMSTPPLHTIARALAWLERATAEGTRFEAAPIGLYFAKLWYAEELYPLLFTVSALGRLRARLEPRTGIDALSRPPAPRP